MANGLLAASHLCGITEVYRVGRRLRRGGDGVRDQDVPAVDKIFGPSNTYVCEAMRQVFGAVGVGGLPGPSELMVIADDTARADYAAADLLAQAEHGSGKEKIYLVTTTARVRAAIAAEIRAQLRRPFPGGADPPGSGRRLSGGGGRDPRTRRPPWQIRSRPSISNCWSPGPPSPDSPRRSPRPARSWWATRPPTALGDFTAGPSHVLPTGRSGRFFSGLRVADFMRRTSLVQYDRASLRRAAPVVAAFAALEQLDAHGRSVEIRTKLGGGEP